MRSAEAGTATPQAGRAQRRTRRSLPERKIRKTSVRGGASWGRGYGGEGGARGVAWRPGGGARLRVGGFFICKALLVCPDN